MPHAKNHTNVALKTTYQSLASNLCLASLKWITGILGNSQALIADAMESTTDVFGSLTVLFGIRYSSKPANESHPYGHGKIEPLITFIVVGFLISSAAFIFYTNLQHILNPSQSTPSVFTLYVLAAIIAWKELSYRFVSSKNTAVKSTTLKAEAWHHRSDAITSLAAFIGISLSIFGGDFFRSAENFAAMMAAIIILWNCYKIFRPAFAEIMDEHIYDDLIAEIKILSTEVEGIIYTEKCQVRKAGMLFYIDLHAVVDGNLSVKEGHDLAHKLKRHLMTQNTLIANVLIHIEPDNYT